MARLSRLQGISAARVCFGNSGCTFASSNRNTNRNAQSHCICPGHRAAHRQAASDALEGYQHARIESTTRLTWLRELQTWFDDHRKGIDARAYAQARSLVQP